MGLRVIELRSELGLLVAAQAVTVDDTDSLSRAGKLMREYNVSALLVDSGRAIISERDMTRALAAGLGPDSPVVTVATPNPVTVEAGMPIVDAAALMLNEEIRHLVVRLPDQRLGIVSLRSLMAVLLQATNPEPWLERLRIGVDVTGSELWLG